MKAYDCFCGVGGLTRGLRNAGITVIAGIDIDPMCRETYTHNNQGTRFINKDIREIGLSDLGLSDCLPRRNNVLFAACAPCQPFSQLSKSGKNKNQSTLLSSFMRLVKMAQPDYVLIENVPGIARVRGFSTFRRALRLFNDLNYDCVQKVINAKYYGVPQNRRRLVLLAAREGWASLPLQSHGPGLEPVRTVQDAIADYPQIPAGGRNSLVLNHVCTSITELNLRRLEETPHDGGDRRSWPASLQLACHSKNHHGHTDVYGRMHWNRPSPTLTGRCTSISNGRFGHPEQNRAISLREAAKLQTFPDDYEFFGYITRISVQIGNAVPVEMAERLGAHILDLSSERHLRNESVVE